MKQYLDDYRLLNFALVPVVSQGKQPIPAEWQLRTATQYDAAEFENGENVGVVLGENSGGLIDIDLDCPDALKIAHLLLPPTDFVFGHGDAPASHRFYRCADAGATRRLTSPSGGTLLECRARGAQTVIPPSTHQSGEPIEFARRGRPAEASYEELIQSCSLMALAIVLAPHWRVKCRHELSLALSGFLLRAGVPPSKVERTISAICLLTHDEEENDRLNAVDTTAEKLRSGQPATGLNTLSKLVGRDVASHVAKCFPAGREEADKNGVSDFAFAKDSLNDAGNAERTKELFGRDLIYVPQLRRFFCWDGDHWHEDTDRLRVQSLCLEAANFCLTDMRNKGVDNEKLEKFLVGSKNLTRINAQVGMLKHLVLCDASELDARPELIGCINGMIDLDTGTHLPPDRDSKITKRIGAEYDPHATCPHFEKLLSDMFGGDEDKIAYLQKLSGYWLSGSTKYHLFPVLWGPGGCGKSKLVNAVASVLGDYSTQMMADTLFDKTAGALAQYDLATFRGKRFVVAQEAESQEKLKATIVKTLTGEDTLKVRLPYQEPWSLAPGAKFLMVANRRPNIDPFDTGLKRRILILECAPPLPACKRDADLGEKLEREKSGILNWMMTGWSRVQQSGIAPPSVIVEATRQFFADRNEIAAFLNERTEKVVGEKTSKADLYDDYVSFCLLDGFEPRSRAEFGSILKRNFEIEESRSGSTRHWRGIRLRYAATIDVVNGAANSMLESFFSNQADLCD